MAKPLMVFKYSSRVSEPNLFKGKPFTFVLNVLKLHLRFFPVCSPCSSTPCISVKEFLMMPNLLPKWLFYSLSGFFGGIIEYELK